MYVLGVNVADQPSACLIAGDGRAVAALEPPLDGAPLAAPAAGHVPERAIARCADALGVGLDRIGVVVLCGDDVLAAAGSHPPSAAERARQLPWSPRTRIHTLDHHLAHACSAFYPSSFDHAAVLVVDRGGGVEPCETGGLGARVRASAYVADGGLLRRVFTVADRAGDPPRGPRSIGAMLERFAAQLTGGDLDSLLDLATRGSDRLRDELARITDGDPPQLAAPGCADAAWAIADLLQHTATQLARQLVERTGARKLCLAGDAAVHGLARLAGRGDPWVDQVYVPPAPGDAGTAVGAALFGWCELLGAPPPCELETAFSGPSHDDGDLHAALGDYRLRYQAGPPRLDQVLAELAELLAGGALAAWVDGPAGLGDALERRCVLASPRALALASRLHPSLCQPSYRAPTALVLADDAEEYFELRGPSPFGHRVARVVPEHTGELPLVVRSDGTSRVQTIDRWRAPRLHDLLAGFRKRGGVPILAAVPLRPIGGSTAERPRDALQLWERAGLEAIYLHGQLLVRSTEHPAPHDES